MKEEIEAKKAARDDWSSDDRVQARITNLQERMALLQQPEEFKVGDIVTWKPGLRNRKVPAYGEPMIVTELNPGMRAMDKESSSIYFQALIDMQCGLIDSDDDDFLQYRFDSTRLMKIG